MRPCLFQEKHSHVRLGWLPCGVTMGRNVAHTKSRGAVWNELRQYRYRQRRKDCNASGRMGTVVEFDPPKGGLLSDVFIYSECVVQRFGHQSAGLLIERTGILNLVASSNLVSMPREVLSQTWGKSTYNLQRFSNFFQLPSKRNNWII